MQRWSKDNADTQPQGHSGCFKPNNHTRPTLQLTEVNLALHNATPYIEDMEARVARIQEVARQLVFELPEECFEEEKWGMSWVG